MSADILPVHSIYVLTQPDTPTLSVFQTASDPVHTTAVHAAPSNRFCTAVI